MKNPWMIDGEKVPDDAGIKSSHGGIGVLGVFLWGSVLAMGAVLLFTNLASGNIKEMIMATAAVLATVAMVVALGWLAYFALTRFSIVGQALVGLSILGFLVFVLPFAWQLLLERTDIMASVSESLSLREPVDAAVGNPVRDALGDSLGVLSTDR